MNQKESELNYQPPISNALQTLINFYHNNWPCDETHIIAQLMNLKTDLNNDAMFQITLSQFHDFITSRAGIHHFRYTSQTWFLGGIRWVYDSPEFSRLKKILQDFTSHEQQSWFESIKSISFAVKEGCVNVTKKLINNPSETILMGLVTSMLLYPTNVQAARPGSLKAHVPNTTPPDSCPNFAPQLYQNIKHHPHSFLSYNPAVEEKKPPVLLFGEHHLSPEIVQIMNKLFSTLQEKSYDNFVNELPESYTLDGLIAEHAPSMFNSINNLLFSQLFQEWFVFYNNLKTHSLNYYSIDDEQQLSLIMEKLTITDIIRCSFNTYLWEWFNCDHERAIIETLDKRNQIMANKILTILKDTEKNVFGRFGRLHTGIALYLLESGYPVTFIACPEIKGYEDNFLIKKIEDERKQIEHKYPHFHYIVLPENPDTKYLEALKNNIFEPGKNKEPSASVVKPQTKKTKEANLSQQEKDTSLKRKEATEPTKSNKSFCFFKAHSSSPALENTAHNDRKHTSINQ